MMKKQINALLVSDLQSLIPNEIPKYLIRRDGDLFIIENLPIIFKNHIKEIRNDIAYDFDELNAQNQNKYQDEVRKYISISANKYKLDTKIYKLKKRK